MIDRVRYLVGEGTHPYQNLGLEEYLLGHVEAGECILYLWQNRQTVVIGRNQNAWKECRVTLLEQDGGFLARRLSGGGAVFHDLGNLNFTFVARQADYDVARQLEVILRAVRKLGVQVEKSGRNDITVEGRKFSGNAFYSSGGRCYHHGTLLIGVDMENLSRYLNVSAEKLESKGVESVKSRVANLTEFNGAITVERMREKLIEAFGEVYDCVPTPILPEELDGAVLDRLTAKFSAWDWRLGRLLEFSCELSRWFDWGDLQLQLLVDAGRVTRAAAFSDALDTTLCERLPKKLTGRLFSGVALADAVGEITAKTALTERMTADIQAFLREKL